MTTSVTTTERRAGAAWRRAGALLLVAEAALVTTPLLAIAGYVAGSRMIGTAVAHVPVGDVIGQAIAQALTPLLTLLLLLAAWGVWHSARGIGGLLLQPVVVTFAVVGFLQPLTAIDAAPSGSRLLLAVAVVTAAVLVVVTVRGRAPGVDLRHRRWWWIAGYATGIVALAAVGAGSRSLPGNPTTLLADQGGGSVPHSASAASSIPQNPGLAPNPFNSIHNDSWATDSYPAQTGPKTPLTAAVDSVFTGGDCATITFDSLGRLITLCSSLTKVIAYIVDPATLTVLSQQEVGSRSPDLTDFSGGGYFVLDDRDRIVFPAVGGVLTVLDTAAGISVADQIPVAGTLLADEKVTSVLPDWRGRYWYVGNKGTVGVVPAGGGSPRAVNLSSESIENSFAVTEDAVYVATGSALYRLWAAAGSGPEIIWRTGYETGTRQKPGQTSRATGTTPTLFDRGRFVAITDNADPQMRVVVAETDSGRVTCQAPVFRPGESATENSLIAAGNTLVVENNYGYRPAVTATVGGHSTVPGLAAIDVEPGSGACTPRWVNDEIHIPSLVSKATLAGNLVLTYTKPPSPLGLDAWYFTAVDLDTGRVAWNRLAGTGTAFNNHYAAGYLSPSGDFVVGTVYGIVVLRNQPIP